MYKIIIFLILIITTNIYGQGELKKSPEDFLPEGFSVFNKLQGDLNKDGIKDYVLIIKGTDKNQFIKDYRGILDRNRRGVIVLLNKKEGYELVGKNYDCFYSENEDGGVYWAPILYPEIKNGNLIFHFDHGRYGSWSYIFRFRNSYFELIGFEDIYPNNKSSEWASFDETSVNLLSAKQLTRKVIKVNHIDGEETIQENWKQITVKRHITLSDIKAFENFKMSSVYTSI